MSHTILILRELHVRPIGPLEWHWGDAAGVVHKWNIKRPADSAMQLSLIEEALADNMWKKITPHEANGGLGDREPDLTIPKGIIAQLLKEGKVEEARALKCIVCKGVWTGDRAHPKDLGRVHQVWQ